MKTQHQMLMGLVLLAGVLLPRLAVAAAPAVDNANGATNILSISATLTGTLTSTGGLPTQVHAYWGTTDGGTTFGNWGHTNDLGTNAAGPLSLDVTNLLPQTTYYYRFYATNQSGTAWAVATTNFQTLLAAGPAPLNLLSTAHFTILSGAGISSSGGTIDGNIGVSPSAGTTITGLTQAQVNGIIYTVNAAGPAGFVMDPVLLTAAKGDLTVAYNDAAGRTPVPVGPFLNPGAGNIGGLNLVPGLYKFTGEAHIEGSDLTLTGGADDVWIFQIATALVMGADGRKIILAGGAQAKNVFWQVGTSATIGTFAVFKGTILADQSITLGVSSTMEGRALARIGSVTFDGDVASLPNVALTIVSAHGTSAPPVGGYSQAFGSTVTNSVTGAETLGGTQYLSTGWSLAGGLDTNGVASGSATNMALVLTNDTVLTWSWRTNYLLNASSSAGGSVTGGTNGWYAAGTNVTVTATPTNDFTFAYWTGNVSGPTNSAVQTLTMDQARTVVAHFVAETEDEDVILTIVSAHGIGLPPAGVYTNLVGALLTNRMSATDTQGGTQYVCTGWSMTGNAPITGTNVSFSMTQTNNATLTWLWSTNYLLTIVPAPGGAVTNAASGWKPAGNIYALYPTNAFGYALDHWIVNGQSAGAGVPLYLTMDEAETVTALFGTTFVDVTAQLDWNVQWVFYPRLGYFIGALTITNRLTSTKAMQAPFWYEVESNAWHWLRFPTGIDTNGLSYLDISAQVNSQLPGTGNGDLYLNPGESVTVTGIQLMGRRTPDTNLVVAVWADPPGALVKPVDTDGDGVSDVDAYIAGTSATGSNGAFRIRLGPGGRSVEWDGQRSRLYTVLASTNLCQSFVPVADGIAGSGNPATYTATPQVLGSGTQNAVFYRVNVRLKEISK